MTKIVAVVNQKGGVGKTTTTLNLATAFSTIGKKILVIDFDPQGNATTGLGVSNKNQFENGYQETCIPNLYLMPASIHLSGAEIELVNIKGREKLLSKVMKDVEKFDFVFIDCPPSLGLLTLNALVAADEVLIPLQCEFYALEGLSQILFTISQVQKKFNPGLSLQGIVLTMFDGRSSLCFQVANDVRQHLKDKVYKTYIPRNVRVAEAPSFGKPVVIYDYKCQGSQAYLQLAREILAQKGKLAA